MDWAPLVESLVEATLAGVQAIHQGTQESEEKALLALEATIAQAQGPVAELRAKLQANKNAAEKALEDKFPEPETKP